MRFLREADERLATARTPGRVRRVRCPRPRVRAQSHHHPVNMVARASASNPATRSSRPTTSTKRWTAPGAGSATTQRCAIRAGAHPLRCHRGRVRRAGHRERTPRTKVLFLSHMTTTAMRFRSTSWCLRPRGRDPHDRRRRAHPRARPTRPRGTRLRRVHPTTTSGCVHPRVGVRVRPPRRAAAASPLVVSWGWKAITRAAPRSSTTTNGRAPATLAAYLATPAAIDWIERQDWSGVQQRCHDLLVDACLRRRAHRAHVRLRRRRLPVDRAAGRGADARRRSGRAEATAVRRAPRRDPGAPLRRPGPAADLDRDLQHHRRRRALVQALSSLLPR